MHQRLALAHVAQQGMVAHSSVIGHRHYGAISASVVRESMQRMRAEQVLSEHLARLGTPRAEYACILHTADTVGGIEAELARTIAHSAGCIMHQRRTVAHAAQSGHGHPQLTDRPSPLWSYECQHCAQGHAKACGRDRCSPSTTHGWARHRPPEGARSA